MHEATYEEYLVASCGVDEISGTVPDGRINELCCVIDLGGEVLARHARVDIVADH